MNSCDVEGAMFSIAASFGGGTKCDKMFLPSVRLLRKLLRPLRSKDYLADLERFEFWLYFGGTVLDYEGQFGPKRLATGRNPPRVIIDFRMAISDYAEKSQEEVRRDLANGLEACFKLMLARALKKKAVKDEARLRVDFNAAMQRFRTEPIPPYVPLGTVQIL